MTNVKFPRKEFEKHLKITDEIIEKISLFGTPLESIYDKEIEIEVFPNRPDLISLQGFMKSFKLFLGKTKLSKLKTNKPLPNYSVIVDESTKQIRPFISCAIVKNLSLNDEKIKQLIDLQEKLHTTIGRNRSKLAIGIYPLDKIKLPISYTTKQPKSIKFRPLESEKELNGYQVLSRHPTGKKYAHLLKGNKKYPVFLDNSGKIISMPPIINSHETGRLTTQTKEVFVECSGFDLKTLDKTLNIILLTLSEMGGKTFKMEVKDKPSRISPDLSEQKTKISLDNVNKLLGLSLKEKEMKFLLEKMGHSYSSKYVLTPPWRIDILHEVDLIEDIAIAYGYEKLPPQIPELHTLGEELPKAQVKDKISEILIGLGLIEISTYHLIKPEEAKLMRLSSTLELENSKTEYKILRQDLLTPCMRILSENIDVDYPQKLFEIGTVFDKDEKEETGVKEKDNLVIALTPSNFTEARQHLEYLLDSLNIEYKFKEAERLSLIPGRTTEILIDKKPIGFIGEVHPNTLKKWRLKMPLAIAEISLEEIYKSLSLRE